METKEKKFELIQNKYSEIDCEIEKLAMQQLWEQFLIGKEVK